MREHRISDDDAQALVTGEAPAERPDLARLALSIKEFRSAASASAPRPSAELSRRLELAAQIDVGRPETSGRPASRGRMKRVFAWITGLGVAAKIVLGVTVAAAAGATGVGAAVGIDTLVSATAEHDVTTDESTDAPADPTDAPSDAPENFGGSVSDRAHELGKGSDGAAFGEEISEEARQLGDEMAQNLEGTGPGESASNGAIGNKGNAPELPDVVPGGDD
jgi:hypothetical protein